MAIDSPTLRSPGPAATAASGARAPAPPRPALRVAAPRPGQAALASARTAAALKGGVAGWDSSAQDGIARAQQAVDYLERVAGQLETLKGDLAARLSGARGDERQLEARVRQLTASLDARPTAAGGGVDARLDFDGGPAQQHFRIAGLDIDALLDAAPQTLAVSIGGTGGPLLTVATDPDLSRQQLAQRFDRALAPMKVHAQLDGRSQLVFSTAEANWPAVKDRIAISGRGRVATQEEPAPLAPSGWDTGNPDALRQSLREVVQALARVRRSQEAARAALELATVRAAQATVAAPAADAAGAIELAQGFATTASSPDYDSLLAVSSALVGVSRERVLALLG